LNADLNASFNIRNNYLDSIRHPSRAPVNEPIVSNGIAMCEAQSFTRSDTSHRPCAGGS
jgi:transposase